MHENYQLIHGKDRGKGNDVVAFSTGWGFPSGGTIVFTLSNDHLAIADSRKEDFMNRINLDAMIPRADFSSEGEEYKLDLLQTFPIANLASDSPYLHLLRKPDFQRETNHWTPRQLSTLVASFLDNELIPSVILWQSPTHIFVIDVDTVLAHCVLGWRMTMEMGRSLDCFMEEQLEVFRSKLQKRHAGKWRGQ